MPCERTACWDEGPGLSHPKGSDPRQPPLQAPDLLRKPQGSHLCCSTAETSIPSFLILNIASLGKSSLRLGFSVKHSHNIKTPTTITQYYVMCPSSVQRSRDLLQGRGSSSYPMSQTSLLLHAQASHFSCEVYLYLTASTRNLRDRKSWKRKAGRLTNLPLEYTQDPKIVLNASSSSVDQGWYLRF